MESNTQSAAMSANWEALTADTVVVSTPPSEVIEETPAEQTKTVEVTNTDTPTETPKEEAPAAESEQKATEPAKEEAPASEVDADLTLSVDDIKDAPKTYEEDSFQALGQVFNLEVKDNTLEAFKAAIESQYVPKEEYEKVAQATKETVLTQFSPEVAAAIQLKEMGIAEQYIFNPTAQHDYLLSLDSATLLRMKLENTPGYETADIIDAQIEEWSANGSLDTKAQLERITLNNERSNILETKSKLVEQYTEEKQQAEVRAKQEYGQKFMDALNKESTFFGLPVSKEVKDVISAKFQKGGYDNVLNNPQSIVKAVLYTEFGEKMSKVALAKAESKGRAEITQKLSNVPIPKGSGGGRVVAEKEEGQGSNWDALPM